MGVSSFGSVRSGRFQRKQTFILGNSDVEKNFCGSDEGRNTVKQPSHTYCALESLGILLMCKFFSAGLTWAERYFALSQVKPELAAGP